MGGDGRVRASRSFLKPADYAISRLSISRSWVSNSTHTLSRGLVG
jgi:hypothetical protein